MSARKKIIWVNIIFFAVTTAFALIGCPLYAMHSGLSGPEIWLFAFYLAATGMSITAGYHRLFSHATYKANPLVQFFFLFFGAAAFEQSALDWSSQHRDHHRYVDTEEDPYSIKKGFFYAHIGWLIFWEHDLHYENVHDLKRNKMVMHQHCHYRLWAVTAGILLPVAIGALSGHALGAFLFSVCLRLTLVYHSTFFINSVCHMFGKATYDIEATAKDSWLVALITNGEGYHNFHHRFPSDFRNGVRWYHWDPSKWMIAFLGHLGLARELKRVSDFRIIAARLAAEKQRAEGCLKKRGAADLPVLQAEIKTQYEKLKLTLAGWENSAREFRAIVRQRFEHHSKEWRRAAMKNVAARRRFRKTLEQWKSVYLRSKPFIAFR